MAVRVEQHVARFDVAVYQVRRVHEVQRLKQLVRHVLLVDLLKNARANDGMQVRLYARCGGQVMRNERVK